MTAESVVLTRRAGLRASPVNAVVWHFVHEARVVVMAVGIVTLLAVGVAWLVPPAALTPAQAAGIVERPPMDGSSKVALGMCLLMMFACVMFACGWPFAAAGNSVQRRGPDRVFRMPLATWKMALAYMTPGLLFVLVVSSAYGIGLTWWLGGDAAWWVAPCACLILTLLGQVWVMLFGAYHGRAGALVLAATVIAAIWALSTSDGDLLELLQPMSPLLVAFAIPAAYATGVSGLRVNRRGGLGSYTHPVLERLENMEIASAPARRFVSAEEAQRWYEWRRLGWMLPLAQGVLIAGYLLFIPAFIYAFAGLGDSFESFYGTWALNRDGIVVCGFLVACAGAMAAGVAMMGIDLQYHFGEDASRRSFFLTRPVSHHVLVRARCHAIVRNMAFSVVPLAGLAVYYLWFPEGQEGLNELFRAESGEVGAGSVSLTSVVAVVVGSFLLMWGLYWVYNAFAAMALLTAVLAPALLFLGYEELSRNPESEAVSDTMFAISTSVFAALLVAFFGVVALRALRSGAVGGRHVLASFGLSVLALATLVAYLQPAGVWERLTSYEPDVYIGVGLAIAMTVVVAAPLVTAPYLLVRYRHRS